MKKRLYLAYGSNLNKEQMRLRCPDATLFGTAALKDYELLFKGSKTGSYLTVERRKGSQVPLGVWEVSEADERALDRYEGCPRFYYKKTVVLPVLNEKTGEVARRRCFLYIMHENRKQGRPSPFYWETCLQGYEDFGFTGEPLVEALHKAFRAERMRGLDRKRGGASA